MERLPEIHCPDINQIKNYCEEALQRSDQYGVEDGLSFLIGSKFYQVFRQLREEQSRMHFLYDESDKSIGLAFRDKALRMNYNLTVNDSYRNLLQRVKKLETTRNEFVGEILDSFEVNDVKTYLEKYPRLGEDSELTVQNGGMETVPLTAQDALSEVQDILCVEDMIRLFS